MTTAAPGLPPPPPAAHLLVFRAINPDYVAVFVEGPDDVETWGPWLRWRPYPAGGCSGVEAAITALRASGARGYLGIVDADCLRLEGTNRASPDLLVSETHDVECDLVRLPALDRLLRVANDQALRAAAQSPSFVDALYARALPFGLLRWLFFRRGREYPDGRLSPFRFVDRQTWTVDEGALHAEAALVTGETTTALATEVNILRAAGHIPANICNGHDVVDVLTIALQGIGGATSKFPKPATVATALRLAVDAAHLELLRLWKDLQAWEVANVPWTVCTKGAGS